MIPLLMGDRGDRGARPGNCWRGVCGVMVMMMVALLGLIVGFDCWRVVTEIGGY